MDSQQIIEALVPWNFWHRDINIGLLRSQYIEHIERYLKTDEVLVLSGIRRCGKSTLLLQVLDKLIRDNVSRNNTLYINFEDPKFYNFLDVEVLETIWQAYLEYLHPKGKVYLVLDEVQKVKGWEYWVRAKYDQHEDVKIFVTGSNADLLSPEFSKVLTGRHLELAVTLLDFPEFLAFKGISIENDRLWLVKNKKILENLSLEYLESGGFPKIVLTKDELLRKELLEQYFNDIITKDVVDRYKIKDVNKLRNLALFYSTNFTHKYTFRSVRKVAEFPLSLDSIHRFSGYMENCYLVDFLPRFSYSLRNQMQVPRKVYFADNGMRNSIAFKFSSDRGKLLENAVFYHLKRRYKELYYFQERQEADFVCKEGIKVSELINVCFDLDDRQTYLREVTALSEAMHYFKLRQGTIITFNGERKQLKQDKSTLLIVPFYQWCLNDAI